jgi:hypothetical protein
MNTNPDFIKFEQNRIFKSKLLSAFFQSANTLAFTILIMLLLYLILSAFGKESAFLYIGNIRVILILWAIVFISKLLDLNYNIVKIDRTNCLLEIARCFNPHYISTRHNIANIRKIIIYPYHRFAANVRIITVENKKIGASIREFHQFAQLLQEINPNIEIEYKEC